MATKTTSITDNNQSEGLTGRSGFNPIACTSNPKELLQAYDAPISAVNDVFRGTFAPALGLVTMTAGFQALKDPAAALKAVQNFSDFTPDNDPHGEHDFGSIVVENCKIFWKIDYYDNDYEFGSEDPSDLNETKRVLTVMLASEY